MRAGHLTNHLIGDAGPLAESCQVQLLHLSLVAHVVHEVVSVPFAAKKGHMFAPAYLVLIVVYSRSTTRSSCAIRSSPLCCETVTLDALDRTQAAGPATVAEPENVLCICVSATSIAALPRWKRSEEHTSELQSR